MGVEAVVEAVAVEAVAVREVRGVQVSVCVRAYGAYGAYGAGTARAVATTGRRGIRRRLLESLTRIHQPSVVSAR